MSLNSGLISIFIPYNIETIINYFTTTYSLDLTLLTDIQKVYLLIGVNIYFFIFWGFCIYFALKIFNRLYERIL